MHDRIAKTPPGPPHLASTSRTRYACCCVLVVALGLLLLVAPGCRSGMEADLIARELRMQEDQLYAMEDYLTQYQQLLRQCRADNHALKCQLAEREGELPPPPVRPRLQPPRTPAPLRAPANNTLPPPRMDEPQPTVPDEIRLPDVPALEETTLDEPHAGRPSDDVAASPRSNSGVVAASIEASARAKEDHHETREPAGVPTHVWLHGEVVAHDAGGGPRLAVDVEPLRPTGHTAAFSGSISLMVLTSGERDPRNLARWDFSPDEGQAARELSPTGRAMRFHLELPAGVAIDEPAELWVRLLPEGGPKLLTHAAIDLRKPARFSSTLDRPRRSEKETNRQERVAVRVVSRDQSRARRDTPVDIHDGTWSVVRPGGVSQLTPQQDQPSGKWQVASEPLPLDAAATVANVPARPLSPPLEVALLQQTVHREATKAAPLTGPVAPVWSPDR